MPSINIDVEANNYYYPEGVHNLSDTIVIPRQRFNVHAPPPYLADWDPETIFQSPSGRVFGKDMFGTVLNFADTVEGALIKTYGAGESNVSGWWNSNNELGTSGFLSVLCPIVDHLSIFGNAQFQGYPYNYDTEHGTGHPDRARGIWMHASGAIVDHVNLCDIPGTAIEYTATGDGQAGQFSMYDNVVGSICNNRILHALNGIVVGEGLSDIKVHHNYIYNIANIGITVYGGVVSDNHVWGSTKSCHVVYPAQLYNNYLEAAAEIGCHFGSSSGGSCSHGHHIGPGTSAIGIQCDASQIEITGLFGSVAPSGIGVKLSAGTALTRVSGNLGIGSSGIGLYIQGHGHSCNLALSSVSSGKTGVKVAKNPNPGYSDYQCNRLNLNIEGYAAAGTLLDLSDSALNSSSTIGETYCNVFKIKTWGGSSNVVLYPGGETTYNLASGNKLYINEVLQS